MRDPVKGWAPATALALPVVLLTSFMPLCYLCTCLSPPLANKLLIPLYIRKYLILCFAYDNAQNGWWFKNIKAELQKVRPGPQGLW